MAETSLSSKNIKYIWSETVAVDKDITWLATAGNKQLEIEECSAWDNFQWKNTAMANHA